jgi:penicillin-binding protein 1A
MVGGRGLRPNELGGEVNMALVPRQTGSSIKSLILATAMETGAQPTDIFDGTAPCTVPDFKNGRQTTKTVTSGGIEVGPFLGRNTWNSTDCGYVRISYAIGLHRVVDSIYRLAHSDYFYQGQPVSQREPFLPLPLTATGNNAMAPIDMASGMESITNVGLHHDPYYVEYVDRADGRRFYTHNDPGQQVLDPRAALNTVWSLKGVLRRGTASRSLARFPREATGKTGTQLDNTNAWFVGGNPQYTTAVWVGDPNGYTPMRNIPEFRGLGRATVQGADYPAKIWGAYMQAALAPLPAVDWAPLPVPTRLPVRFYVPGVDCLAKLVSGTLPPTGPTTATTKPPATTTTTTIAGSPPPPPTTAPKAVIVQIPSGTTVPESVTDPKAAMPYIDLKTIVYTCLSPPPNVIVQPKKGK